jgi:hypothetical protein
VVDEVESRRGVNVNPETLTELEAASRKASRALREQDGRRVDTYRCQGTEAIVASEPLNSYDPRQYFREIESGNLSLAALIAVMARTAWRKALRILRLRTMLGVVLPDSDQSPKAPRWGVRIGELVQIRSPDEIAMTLNRRGRNRGLSFAPEMVRYCGKTFRVRDRVERLIDEKTGQMIEISNDCLILDGAVCPGEDGCFSYLFCPRGTYPFWREAWVQPVNADKQAQDRAK